MTFRVALAGSILLAACESNRLVLSHHDAATIDVVESGTPDAGSLFVPVEQVRRDLELGAAVTFIDARPPADYAVEHIAGAISLPYYDGSTRWNELLPLSRKLITYCGCPHTESEYLARVLIPHGFTDVHVLDEGFWIWRERGYPTVTGPDAGVMPGDLMPDGGLD